MFNLLCGLFSGGGNNCNGSQCAANVCFQAIDSNDCPICGAVYRLTCACGKFLNAITNRNGCVTFCGICPGTYDLTQELAPFGYLLDDPPQPHKVVVSKNCCVKIDGLPMRCFQSINNKDNTPVAPSDRPIVAAIDTATDTIEGTGVAGCKIKVEFPSPERCCCCTTVRRNGTWSIDVPAGETLLEGETVIVTQCCPCLRPSDPVRVTVDPAITLF